MELKYDFIDQDHKRMHNALIAAGWTCKNDVYPTGSSVKFNWVYSTIDQDIYFNKEVNLNHRNKYFYPMKFYNKSFSEVANIIEAELEKPQLNKIPDQLMETQEEQEYQPITKDNIAEVLEYNGIDKKLYMIDKCYITCLKFVNIENYGNCISFRNPKWLQLVEVYFGKLKPLPLPKFDFVQYLLDNGFKEDSGNLYNQNRAIKIIAEANKFYIEDCEIQPTETNAKIVVQMAKLAEELS